MVSASPANGSETRFQTLFEQAPFSLQLIAADGRTLRVNQAWQDLWQIQDGDRGLHFVLTEYDILQDPQLVATGVTDYLRRAFAGESVETPPTLYDPAATVGKPGRERWIIAHFHPIRDAQGNVPEVMLIHEDVTERMRAENELRASEMRLKQLANTIPQLAWIADAKGDIYWFNDRWYAYTGTTPEQMANGGWASVHDSGVVADVLAFWQRTVAEGEPVHMTFPLRGHDGVSRPFFTRVAPLKDAGGAVMQWFGTNTDVSPLRDAEEELRQTEERLRLATDAGNIGIWEWHLDQDLVTWSEKVYQLHGMAPGEFGGRAADFQKLVHPDDLPMLWSRVEAAVKSRDGFAADFRVLLPSGGERWLSTWARVHHEASGPAVRLIGATISIDDYKRAEAALMDSDRRKDEFLAMLAHELRNPLAPISSAAELLKRASGDARIVHHAGDVIARQVRHMTELVDDLLDVSRVTRGLVQLEMAPVDLNTIVTSAIEQVRPLIDARQHVVTTWSGAGRTWVQADRTRLVQVVGNLLNNAAKYTPPGGRIDVRVEVHGRVAHVVVRDDGNGIEPKLLPHVFELFAQGERTPDRAQGGLGIGLALVKSLVMLHGGTVEALSQGPGTGSTFRVQLPIVDNAPVSVHAPAGGAPAAVRARRIVVVDDNVDAAETLAAVFVAEGHEVRVFNDATSLLAAELSVSPHLFVLDIGLPDLDGYELARRLRQRSDYREALFVALTGYGQAGDRERSHAAGFHHHFVKPVESAVLERLLAELG